MQKIARNLSHPNNPLMNQPPEVRVQAAVPLVMMINAIVKDATIVRKANALLNAILVEITGPDIQCIEVIHMAAVELNLKCTGQVERQALEVKILRVVTLNIPNPITQTRYPDPAEKTEFLVMTAMIGKCMTLLIRV